MPGLRSGPISDMKTRYFHIISILLLALVVCVNAQTVSVDGIIFEGNSAFPRKQLLGYMNSRDGEVSGGSLEDGCKTIMDVYHRSGYYQAECRVEYNRDSSSSHIFITEGLRYLLGDIYIEGNSYLGTAYLQSLMNTGRNQVLDSAAITRDMQEISLAYADNGFPQAEIFMKDLKYTENRLDITIGIEENSKVWLSKVSFQGNLTTKNTTMLKLSGLNPGSPFSRIGLDKAIRRLNSSGLFSEVVPPLLITGTETGRQEVLFRVKEAKFNRIFGAASYIQSSAEQNGWLAGSIDLFLGNIAGTARSASVRWERPQKENSRLELAYYEPFLLGFDASARGWLKHMVEDSSYVKSTAGSMIKIPMGEGFHAGIGAEYERIVPGASLIYQKSNKYSTKWLLEWQRSRITANSSTISLKFEADYGRKSYYQPSQHLTVSKITTDLASGKEVFPRQEIYLAIKGRTVITGEKPVPRYDQFVMGGTSSLRGYYQEQFIANQIAWSNFEYRYSPVKTLILFPFADLGYFYDRERNLRGYRSGYGFGFKLDSRIGWINISYGLGQDDTILNGKVHFGLESVF